MVDHINAILTLIDILHFRVIVLSIQVVILGIAVFALYILRIRDKE